MYSKFQLAYKFFSHYLSASNGKGHGTHSPFVFEFITRVLNDKTIYPAYKTVEALRSALLADQTTVVIEEMGAGSSTTKSAERSIASIARYAAKSPKYGQLLFRMVQHYQPKNIIELGTSLGITTSYLALANPRAQVISMEGATNVMKKATANFNKLGLKNIEQVEGNFDNTLPSVLQRLPSVDFAFIDGNHRFEPTLRYFDQIVPNTHNDSILVFDDIHWSREMEEAWEKIKSNSAVCCSIDLFFIGLVFFRKEFREKQHFSIRF